MTAELYHFLYKGLTLKTVGLVMGAALLIGHLVALLKPDQVKGWLKALPRNEKFGLVLVAIDFAWALLVWSEMDLGEFYNVERPVQLILILGCIGVMTYVREFLAVRAIGFFFILAAAPILNAAFLEPPISRLLLVALSYAWILIGMFWVGMPYLMRDQINWLLAEPKRWKPAALGGLVYGALVLVCAVAFY
ncbi:MAG: hypothetical protein KDN19_09940 [Verrucomicrobiae bacterium]|nr:hypothetical protein [Verrucomicrobiae bacterium]